MQKLMRYAEESKEAVSVRMVVKTKKRGESCDHRLRRLLSDHSSRVKGRKRERNPHHLPPPLSLFSSPFDFFIIATLRVFFARRSRTGIRQMVVVARAKQGPLNFACHQLPDCIVEH